MWQKSPILADFVPNHTLNYLKFVLDQNDYRVAIIEGETLVDNLRYGAAMVTKIVKNTLNIKGCRKKQICPLKT